MDNNPLQLLFLLLSAIMLSLGTITIYGDRYVPTVLVQIFSYGRANMSKAKPSFVKSIEIPKSWFAHFYLFSFIGQSFIVPSLINMYVYHTDNAFLKNLLAVVGGGNRETTVSVSTTILVVVLFWFQVGRRLFETKFVMVYSDTKMNILHYALAFTHYTGSMLSIIAHSPGVSNSLQELKPQLISWTNISLFQILAVLLFMYGSYEQYMAHLRYANLRKNKDKIITYGHTIPTGGLFELISCPNYFAEILIYISIACVFQLDNPTWNVVTLWVVCNQVISGYMNHKWYLEKFPEYPKQRKAVIPFLY